MGMVQMNNNNGHVTGGLVELNKHIRDENTKIRDGVTGEGQGLSEEDESRINEDTEDSNNGKKAVVQRRGPMISWERFLPLRSMNVLLVENDDSTRHVVCALLRNCGYEVTAVSNVLQAWKILEDLNNHIDLILNEVLMPCLSGIGLLNKIMNHKTCKDIPVIMMSSHDSMNIVLKCLSEGAVEFLVKPIRKNELKNLWQHVWRKCHSSSGSGSESGIRTQKSTKSKSADSDNSNGCNKEDDFGSVGLKTQDRSDNGSGTQNSWTKRVVEVNSSQPISTWDQIMHSRSEVLGNSSIPVTATRECDDRDDELDNAVMGKDLHIGVPKVTALQLENPSEKVSIDDEKLEKAQLELNYEKVGGDLRNRAADARIGSAVFDIPNGLSKVICKTKETTSLELSLKKPISAHERSVLKRSAFSRYNSGSITNQAPIGNVGSCSPLDNNSEAANTDSMKTFQPNSNSLSPKQRSNGSSNNNDMGSTTNKPAPKTSVPSSAFKSVHNDDHAPAQDKADAARDTDQQVQVQHHHHHYHHYHHHVHKVPEHANLVNNDDSCLRRSSNISSAPHVEVDASESNHGSNEQNGNVTALSIGGLNLESENGPEKGGNGDDQNRFSQREAALNKFRKKRKERCFDKKVRYQSRKKLAEQRPRIRGQFVRQIYKNWDTNC